VKHGIVEFGEALPGLALKAVRQEARIPVHGFTPRGYRCTCGDQRKPRTPP
jgi:hypothetical protein